MSKKQFFTNFSSEEMKEFFNQTLAEGLKHFKVQSDGLNDLIKASEVMDILKISKPTLYNWMGDGLLTGYYLGSRLFFKRSEILDKLNSNCTKKRPYDSK